MSEMRNELISVIVPVYNVENYLRKCVDSIINQTYKNLEIILVDDGSPDNCPAICDEYAAKDSRIKVIHKKNGGLSDARNAGTEIATGEYITYIDSDDYVDEKFIEVLTDGLNADSGGKKIDAVAEMLRDRKHQNMKGEITYSLLSPPEILSMMCYVSTSACAKLFSRRIAGKFPFPLGKIYEDLATVYKMLGDSECVVYCNALHYNYVFREGSICHDKWNDRVYDIMEAAENLLAYIDKNYPEIHYYGVYRYFFSANIFINRAYDSPDFKNIISPVRKKLKELLPELREKNGIISKDYFKFWLLVYVPKLKIIITNINMRIK